MRPRNGLGRRPDDGDEECDGIFFGVRAEVGGGGRIRTFETVRCQIYSLMRLTTSLPHRETAC